MQKTQTRIELGEGAWAVADLDLDCGTVEDLGSGEMARIREALSTILVETNLVDRHGRPLDLSIEGLRRLRVADLRRLSEALGKVLADPLARSNGRSGAT